MVAVGVTKLGSEIHCGALLLKITTLVICRKESGDDLFNKKIR